MTKVEGSVVARLEPLFVPILAMAAVVLIVDFETVLPVVAKLFSIMVLWVVAWASWVGYRQNRRRNREWPINLVVLTLSSVAVAGLALSFFF